MQLHSRGGYIYIYIQWASPRPPRLMGKFYNDALVNSVLLVMHVCVCLSNAFVVVHLILKSVCVCVL